MGWQDAPEIEPVPNVPVPAPAWAAAPELSAGPAADPPPINMSRESDFSSRAMAGLKLGAEGKARYLEGRYGAGNVATNTDGSFYVKEGGEWHPFDSPDLTTKDIADWSGAAVAAAPAIVAAPIAAPATIAGGLALGAATGLAGSGLQQAVGAATPGGDPMSAGERLGQAALDAGAGALGEAGGQLVSRAISAPRNAFATQTGRAATPVAQEGKQIEQFLGVSLTPGQISQRRSLLTLEGALRRSPTKAADLMADLDARQLAAARGKWDDLLSRVSASPQTAELLGGQVGKAFDDTVSASLKALDSTAKRDFSVLDTAAGQTPLFRLPNATTALDDLIKQYDVPGAAADATTSLVRQLKSLRDTMAGPPLKPGGLMGMKSTLGPPAPALRSGEDMQRLLSSWGRAANGKQKMFPDLDSRENVGIAKRVFGALNQDLDAAVPGSPVVAGALRAARDNYRTNIANLDAIRQTAIGRYLGNAEPGQLAPEQIAGRLQGMKPTQLKQTFDLLSKADPEIAGAAKRYMLESAMTAAEPSAERVAQAAGAGVTPEAYSPARLIGNLAKSPVMSTLDPNEKFAVQMLNSSFGRLANRGGTEGSPTAPLLWAMDIAKNLMTAGLAGDVIGGVRLATSIAAPTRLAEAIANPAKTKALMALAAPNANREAVLGAISTLGLMDATRADSADVRPDAMPGRPAQ